MTDVTPRPMETPDLAGLLRKPSRPLARRVGVESSSTDDDFARPVVTVGETPRATDNDERASHDGAAQEAEINQPGKGGRARRSRSAESAASAGPTRREYLRSMPISLPRSLHQQLDQRARADGSTRTAIILTAVNRAHDSIGSALNPPAATGSNDLFEIPQRGSRGEPSVETTIRVTDRQQSAIEALASTHQINRSRLISTALAIYLR